MKAFQLVFAGLLMATSAFGIVGNEGTFTTQLADNQQVTLAERLADNDALAAMETPAKPTFAQKMATKLLSKKLAKKLDRELETMVGEGGGGNVGAILSLVFGCLALLLFWVPLINLLFGIPALVLGLVSLKKTDKKVMSILGIVFGGIATLVGILYIL